MVDLVRDAVVVEAVLEDLMATLVVATGVGAELVAVGVDLEARGRRVG